MSFNRTVEQRHEALVRANGVRSARATLKLELKSGEKYVGDVLDDPPGYVLKMKVYDLLLALPRVGTVKANKVLKHCRISATRTIGGLSDRQRRELVMCVQRAHVGINQPHTTLRSHFQ